MQQLVSSLLLALSHIRNACKWWLFLDTLCIYCCCCTCVLAHANHAACPANPTHTHRPCLRKKGAKSQARGASMANCRRWQSAIKPASTHIHTRKFEVSCFCFCTYTFLCTLIAVLVALPHIHVQLHACAQARALLLTRALPLSNTSFMRIHSRFQCSIAILHRPRGAAKHSCYVKKQQKQKP